VLVSASPAYVVSFDGERTDGQESVADRMQTSQLFVAAVDLLDHGGISLMV
jgi:hypothetical protein